MSITTLDQTLFYRDWTLFQVFAGTIGTADPRDPVNLGDGKFRTVVDIDGVWDVDQVVLVTRETDDDMILQSARFFRDGIRLAIVTGIEVSVDALEGDVRAVLYAGDDLITGSKWKNILRGYDGDDTIRGGWGDDRIAGNVGNDWLNGLAGNDRLYGGTGNDILLGGNENDILFGNAGFDRISGGTGRDRMTGGDRRDTFVFREGDGRDVITDFDPRVDQIRIAVGAETFAEIRLREAGDDVIMAFADVRVRLLGIADQIERITASDFDFG